MLIPIVGSLSAGSNRGLTKPDFTTRYLLRRWTPNSPYYGLGVIHEALWSDVQAMGGPVRFAEKFFKQSNWQAQRIEKWDKHAFQRYCGQNHSLVYLKGHEHRWDVAVDNNWLLTCPDGHFRKLVLKYLSTHQSRWGNQEGSSHEVQV
jgi:hypothetical protein